MSYKYNQNPNKQFKDGRTPVKDYLKSKEFRENRLWRLCMDGIMRTEVSGKWIRRDIFISMHPVFNPIHFKLNPNNADKTRNYLL